MNRSAWHGRGLLAGSLLTFASVLATAPPAGAGTVAPPESPGVVIQVDLADGYTITDVTARFGVVVDRVMVAGAGIYRVRPVRKISSSQLTQLAAEMENSRPVRYALPGSGLAFNGTRFHSWPSGSDDEIGDAPDQYFAQPAASQLQAVHAVSRGAGVRVAVLDTGVEATHPALRGKVEAGYDYVDDDADASERRAGVDSNGDGRVDSSYGHGTFVAGLVTLLAPDATILPMRVLDSDGTGDEVVIAQAIRDAVDAHADVINLSFGTNGNVQSAVIDSALYYAENSGALVVISAGNTGSSTPLYPANSGDALSVTALGAGTDAVAGYASRGSWVELAAPATNVVGPVPGGGYARWSGTSMAAPLVSGQAALVEAAAPQLTLDLRIKVLTTTARKIGSSSARYGAVDVAKSLAQVR